MALTTPKSKKRAFVKELIQSGLIYDKISKESGVSKDVLKRQRKGEKIDRKDYFKIYNFYRKHSYKQSRKLGATSDEASLLRTTFYKEDFKTHIIKKKKKGLITGYQMNALLLIRNIATSEISIQERFSKVIWRNNEFAMMNQIEMAIKKEREGSPCYEIIKWLKRTITKIVKGKPKGKVKKRDEKEYKLFAEKRAIIRRDKRKLQKLKREVRRLEDKLRLPDLFY